ncbi:MAG: hypothetical protein KGZ25_10785, partial [Planctomycetes bacterium]|nr:hypothetical protein [Planctomycetota bacterium]
MNDISDFWKLEPQAVLKPWGLTHKEAFHNTGIRVGLGELWLASAQTGEGNFASNIAGSEFKNNLAELLIRAADAGEKTFKEFVGKTPYAMMKDNPHRGKTEAWYVRKAQGRVGFASGPRT